MSANENNDVPPVGEEIPIDGAKLDADVAKLKSLDIKPEDNNAEIAVPRPPRRRKKLASAGNDGADKPKDAPKGESPPRDFSSDAKRGGDKQWRQRYGAHNGRELMCVTLAGYWDNLCVQLANYINEAGGRPVIRIADSEDSDGPTDNQRQFAALLVLAVDDILPPGLEASPALIAGAGTTTLLIQAAVTARRQNAKKEPAKRSFVEKPSQPEPAAPKDANPPDESVPQSPPKKEKGDTALKDRQGNRAV